MPHDLAVIEVGHKQYVYVYAGRLQHLGKIFRVPSRNAQVPRSVDEQERRLATM